MTAHLRKMERACLTYLAAHPDRFVDRRELLTEVWKCSPDVVTRRVDATIFGIRKFLGYQAIESTYFAGYRFKAASKLTALPCATNELLNDSRI